MQYDQRYEKDLLAIKQIGKSNLGETIKSNAYANMRGAMIGGGVGVFLGVASRQNIYVFGMIGVIAGRLLLSK